MHIVEEAADTVLLAGKVFTVTGLVVAAEQFVVASVTVTVYEVVEEGDTTLLLPLALIGAPQL